MLKITKTNDNLRLEGHTRADLCAAYSTAMYVSVNMLLSYDKDCIDYLDKNDIVNIKILKHDSVIDMIIENMINAFYDIHNQGEGSSEIIIVCR